MPNYQQVSYSNIKASAVHVHIKHSRSSSKSAVLKLATDTLQLHDSH